MKIIVNSEEEKQELLKQSEYLHNFVVKAKGIWESLDSDRAGTLMHIYMHPDMIIIEESDESIGNAKTWTKEKLETVKEHIKKVSEGLTEGQIQYQKLLVLKYEIEEKIKKPSTRKNISLDLVRLGMEAFNNAELFKTWLFSKTTVLDGKKPIDSSDEELSTLLTTINWCIYR